MVSTWKRELQDNASELVDSKQNKPRKGADGPDTDQLYREIGQLTVERDFLSLVRNPG